jgi:hypothetical protein
LNRNAADEAGAPSLGVAKRLKLAGGLENAVHERSFENHRCISTKPEVRRGGKARIAWLQASSNWANTTTLSASAI